MIRSLLLLTLVLFSYAISAQEWEIVDSELPFLKDHPLGIGYGEKGYVITGGDANSNSKSVWEFDTSTNRWERLEDYPGPTRAVTAGDIWDDKLFFGFGFRFDDNGNYQPLTDLWVFDPSDMSFEELPSCPCQGRSHPAFIADKDRIYMGSGTTANGDLKDWWKFDMITEEWTQLEDIPGGRRHHPFQFIIDDIIYVGGGHDERWSAYDTKTDTWSDMDGTPGGRVAGTQFSFNGKGYVLSGDDRFHNDLPKDELFMEYDPLTDSWTKLPTHEGTGRWACSHFIVDSYVYLIGGYETNSSADRVMHRYNLDPGMVSNVEDINLDASFAYPNPFVNELNLDTEKLSDSDQLKIVDIYGRKVVEMNSMDATVNTAHLIPGVYYLQVTGEDGKLKNTVKLVKQ